MSACLFTEVKKQYTILVLGWVTALVHYLCLFAAHSSRPKPLSAMLFNVLVTGQYTRPSFLELGFWILGIGSSSTQSIVVDICVLDITCY